MNPDQTAPKQSDLGPYCLQFRHPKCTSTTKVVIGGKRDLHGFPIYLAYWLHSVLCF